MYYVYRVMGSPGYLTFKFVAAFEEHADAHDYCVSNMKYCTRLSKNYLGKIAHLVKGEYIKGGGDIYD